MTYFERVTSAYRDAMLNKGISGDVVNWCLYAFETGFAAGTLKQEDISLQQQMVDTLLSEDVLN